jgi:hypothetical protein
MSAVIARGPFGCAQGRLRPRSNPAAAGAEPAGLLRTLCVLAMTVLFLACASPEARRTRGGGPGADVGNRGSPVELHAGAQPYHQTPCVTDPVECNGPLPVFGPTPPPD